MVRKALFWSFAGNGATMLVTFIGTIVIARLLSPRELGIYAVATATIAILALFVSFGVGAYVIRETELGDEKLDAAFTVNAVLSVALGIAIFLLGHFGAYLLREPAVADVLQLLALSPIISAIGFRPTAMLQRQLIFRGPSIIGVICTITTTLGTILAALNGASYMSPAYGGLAASVLGTVLIIAIGREHFSLRFSLHEWRKIAAFGIRIMSISGVSSAASRLSDIIVGHFLGLAALGLYSRATNLNNMIFANIYAPMTRVVFSQLSEAQRDGDRVTEVFFRGFRMIVAVVGPVLLGLAVLANPLVLLIYGEKWIGAALPLTLMLLGQFISLAFAMNWELFVIRDELKVQTRLEIARSVFTVASKCVGGLFSLAATAASTIVDSLFSLAIYGRHMPRLARLPERALLNVYGEALLLSLTAALPSLLLMAVHRFGYDVPLYQIAPAILIGGVGWLGLLRRLNHPLVHELKRLLARARGAMRRSEFGDAREVL
jgi:O-antigen/teichoic acid export membrane protein